MAGVAISDVLVHRDEIAACRLSEAPPIVKRMIEEAAGERSPRLTTADLHALVARLDRIEPGTTDAELVAQLEVLERIKSAAAAAQARATHRLTEVQPGRGDASLGAEIGLARRESPHAGRRHLDLARALIGQLPHTLHLLSVGALSEARAMIIAAETQHLAAADRRTADAELYDDAGDLGELQLRDRTRQIAFRLDEAAASRRHLAARRERQVTGRSLGDGTARIIAVVKQEHFAAVIGALDAAASSARAAGDRRTHGQVKADTLVGRITGLDTTTALPVRVNLVINAETLLGQSTEPGHLEGTGPVPATLCRDLVLRASAEARATLRRLYVTPDDRELVTLQSRQRTFPRALAELIDLRDGGTCRTPWCNAPIRHHDHVVPARRGGRTDLDNGQGLCELCNYVKESPGWVSWVSDTGRHQVGTLTPAQQVHHSHPPPLTGDPGPPPLSRIETYFANLVLAA